MTVQTNGFIYDGKTSDDFGLIVCKIDGSNASDTSGGEIEITKVESPIQNRWIKSGNSNYTSALQFGFQVCKSNFKPFDAYSIIVTSIISLFLIIFSFIELISILGLFQ